MGQVFDAGGYTGTVFDGSWISVFNFGSHKSIANLSSDVKNAGTTQIFEPHLGTWGLVQGDGTHWGFDVGFGAIDELEIVRNGTNLAAVNSNGDLVTYNTGQGLAVQRPDGSAYDRIRTDNNGNVVVDTNINVD
jgi:hypothetical protein